MALAQLVAPGSTIYAVDLDQRALKGIPDRHCGVEIRKIVADLQSSGLRLPPVDGILMANTLHFIQKQQISRFRFYFPTMLSERGSCDFGSSAPEYLHFV
jgi:hypothetical protein